MNYIVYDLETGGLKPEENAITEIAMIIIDGETLEETYRYSTFIRPYAGLKYDQIALDLTGVTMDMVENGKDAKVVVKEVCEIIKAQGTSNIKKPVLCGHNIIKFDNNFLDKLLSTYRKDLYSMVNKDCMIDTMWWSRIRNPVQQDQFGKHTLQAACSRGGIEIVDAHRAMNDAAPNAQLVISYLKHLRGSGELVAREKEHSFRETFNF